MRNRPPEYVAPLADQQHAMFYYAPQDNVPYYAPQDNTESHAPINPRNLRKRKTKTADTNEIVTKRTKRAHSPEPDAQAQQTSTLKQAIENTDSNFTRKLIQSNINYKTENTKLATQLTLLRHEIDQKDIQISQELEQLYAQIQTKEQHLASLKYEYEMRLSQLNAKDIELQQREAHINARAQELDTRAAALDTGITTATQTEIPSASEATQEATLTLSDFDFDPDLNFDFDSNPNLFEENYHLQSIYFSSQHTFFGGTSQQCNVNEHELFPELSSQNNFKF